MRQIFMNMTVQQISERYGYSISSIQKNFTRTSAAIKKRFGVTIYKTKKNGEISYQISDDRAVTIYEQNAQLINIGKETLSLENFEFFSLLGVIVTPWGTFRGTKKDFLNYIGISISEKNLFMLDQALKSLHEKQYIGYVPDEDDYINVFLMRKIEREIKVKIDLIKHCRDIAQKNHKSKDKVFQLIKVWIAFQICAENQPFTYEDVSKLTGLSYAQIRDVKKLLEQDQIFKTTRAGTYFLCQGMNADMNAFYN